MKMRQDISEALGKTADGEPQPEDLGIKENSDEVDLEPFAIYWYARGMGDEAERLLPDVISWRKTREWLKDWCLSMPIDDLERVTGAKE
jgi:hypothetical protein